MKGILLILMVLLPTTLLAQEYEVKKRCKGNATNAMVVEYEGQYFIVKTPRYFQRSWSIYKLFGITAGGSRTLTYFDGNGSKYQMEVDILSRGRWNYSGYSAAKAICRKVTQVGSNSL